MQPWRRTPETKAAHITNLCVLNLYQVQLYSRDEHGCMSGFQPVLFFFSAWIKDAPYLPWKVKTPVISSSSALKMGSLPSLWVELPQTHFWWWSPRWPPPPASFLPQPIGIFSSQVLWTVKTRVTVGSVHSPEERRTRHDVMIILQRVCTLCVWTTNPFSDTVSSQRRDNL